MLLLSAHAPRVFSLRAVCRLPISTANAIAGWHTSNAYLLLAVSLAAPFHTICSKYEIKNN